MSFDGVSFAHQILEALGSGGNSFADDNIGSMESAVAIGGLARFVFLLEDVLEVVCDLITQAAGVGELTQEKGRFFGGTGEHCREAEREPEKSDGFALGNFEDAFRGIIFRPKAEVTALSAE